MTVTATETRRRTTDAAPDTDWRDSAACRYVDPDLHFPESTKSGSRTQLDEAKRVCGGCLVRKVCLEWALDTGQNEGVWGGKSPRQRREMRRPKETSFTFCLSRRAWIEKQLAAGASQNEIARRLRVDKNTVAKAVRQFNAEREQAAAQGVTV